jgi:solute carrier family 25 oxoglutarate transporter 11
MAGFMGAVCCLPFDNMKTKLFYMVKSKKTGKFPYSNMFDCMIKSIKQEGFTKLWVGFPTFYSRIAPFTMIVFILTIFLTYNRPL